MNNEVQVQKLVSEWFEGKPTHVLLFICRVFTFEQKEEDIDGVLGQFLNDMAFSDGWLNYRWDLDSPDRIFNRMSYSDVGMMDMINKGLLVECFNRLNRQK